MASSFPRSCSRDGRGILEEVVVQAERCEVAELPRILCNYLGCREPCGPGQNYPSRLPV